MNPLQQSTKECFSLIRCCSVWTKSGFKIARDHTRYKGDYHSTLIYDDDAGTALEALPRRLGYKRKRLSLLKICYIFFTIT